MVQSSSVSSASDDLVRPLRTTEVDLGWERFPDSSVERTIGDLFLECANRHADREAISSPSATWTYRALEGEVRRMAGGITTVVGSDHGRPVALLCNHDGPLIAAMMAVLCAGHAVIILDTTLPYEQNTMILDAAEPALLLADAVHIETASRLASRASCECRELDELIGDFSPPTSMSSSSPAMLAFTSGTSDTPKGAIINHGVILNAVRGGKNALGQVPDDRLPLFFPLSLTIAAFPVFLALLNGSCVAVLDVRAVGIAPIANFLERERITLAFLAPTVVRFMLDGIGEQRFKHLRMVMLAGEPVDSEILASTCAAFRCEEMAVAYGITETGLLAIAVYRHDDLPDGDVTCGYAIPEVDLVIVDDNGQPVEPGTVGEIVVVSDHLFDGYVGRPELDRLVLADDPTGMTSRPAYRTGDLGRVDNDGVLTLEGRSGSSVKVRGRMVALGEVEKSIRELDNVLDAAVLATPLDDVVELVAYVVPKDTAEAEPIRWRASLLAREEPHRVPTRWVALDQLPLLPNGKVNRRALPLPALSHGPRGVREPMSPNEGRTTRRIVRDLWEELLPISSIGEDEDFFELGGDSLLAARMLVMLEHRTGLMVPMGQLIHARTVRDLAAVLNRLSSDSAEPSSAVTCVQRGKESVLPRLWFVHDLQGSAFRARHVAVALGAQQPVWGFESPFLTGRRNNFSTMEAFAANYVNEMRGSQPQGPYWLAGYSFGGICAYEMARQLSEAGQDVAFLGVIDIGPGFRGRGWNSRRSPLRPWFGIAPPPEEGATLVDAVGHYRSMAMESPARFARHMMVRTGVSRVVDPVRFELDLKRKGVVRPEWRLWYSWEEHWKLLARHWGQSGGYPGSIDLFWATETASSDATMGWDPMTADLRVHIFSGDHFGVLEERGADSLAAALETAIAETISRGGYQYPIR